jgi:hypothetical protein
MNKFWYVFRVGGRAPSFRHNDYASAEREAQRLCSENGWGEYLILEAVASIAPAPKTVTTVYLPANGAPMPF